PLGDWFVPQTVALATPAQGPLPGSPIEPQLQYGLVARPPKDRSSIANRSKAFCDFRVVMRGGRPRPSSYPCGFQLSWRDRKSIRGGTRDASTSERRQSAANLQEKPSRSDDRQY